MKDEFPGKMAVFRGGPITYERQIEAGRGRSIKTRRVGRAGFAAMTHRTRNSNHLRRREWQETVGTSLEPFSAYDFTPKSSLAPTLGYRKQELVVGLTNGKQSSVQSL
jgi:hypothetical protein